MVGFLSAFEIQKITFQKEGVNKRGMMCVVREGWCGLLSSVSAGRMQGQEWVIASPPPAVCLFLIRKKRVLNIDMHMIQVRGVILMSLLWHTQSHREWICLLKLIRHTPYDLRPLGLDRKKSVFHQNNKCGQGDLTFNQQRHAHISTIVHLWD